MITHKKLENYLYHAVELTDCDGIVKRGWFVINQQNEYILLPCDDIWGTYTYKASHIKKIKFLTNGYEVK